MLYWLAPSSGLLRVIYNNTALSTAALGFAFLLADTLGPWLLIRDHLRDVTCPGHCPIIHPKGKSVIAAIRVRIPTRRPREKLAEYLK